MKRIYYEASIGGIFSNTKLPRILTILCMAVIIVGASTTCSASNAPTADLDKIDEYVLSEMKAAHIPGLSLGIVKGTETVYLKGFGEADPTGRAVTPQTPFAIASVSKSLTALSIMQLVEEGKVELDAPVIDYIPSFHTADQTASSKITVRQLLNQTSGLSTHSGVLMSAERGTKTIDQLVQALDSARLSSSPGERFHYSNANYILLADIVQRVSGESYSNYVQDHIFKPLDMKSSYVDRPEELEEDAATGYQPWFGFPIPLKENDPVTPLINTSSAEDMTHYLIALMNDGVYEDQPICTAQSIELMEQPAAEMRDKVFYGMGFEIDHTKTGVLIKHPGDTTGFNANIAIIPEGQWGIILLENVDWLGMQGETNTIISGIEQILSGQNPSSPINSPAKMYFFFNTIYIISIALILRSYITLGTWRKRITEYSRKRLSHRLIPITINDFAIPIGMLIGLPKFFSANWHVAFLNAPDFAVMMIGISSLLLVLGLIKTTMIVRQIRVSAT